VLQWPARSPDCNPIEHMWDKLIRRLRQRPHDPNTVDELSQALLEEWNNIPRRVHRNLCTPMTRRVQKLRFLQKVTRYTNKGLAMAPDTVTKSHLS